MGFRFRRRINIFPGLSLNVGKTGVSVSAGVKGAKITLGKHGVRKTIGLPGTGLSYTLHNDDYDNTAINSKSSSESTQKSFIGTLIVIIALAIGGWLFFNFLFGK